ncbi:uncharacterized protein EI90DRAFT_3016691 [Cantharellus anzutake]|uniref:uncharacterized protein n=1 Tax=Cantharellus anzutake TaxID=1750568 RepID=UPI0019072A03|nr:uncharacterized protein EI90DRAFT_3016691 [Cantharellus anzutake]KAF8330873.1 hypothetical protein EI90DRAFT_3016691 [Cantharellus anzutake]
MATFPIALDIQEGLSSVLINQITDEEELETPKVHLGRTLILCFDGTANEYDDTNTNIVRLFSCLEKSHPKQLVYYQTGIGTYTSTRFSTSIGQWISKTIDQGVALHLDDHVCGGYRFLQSNWNQGDKICIFGFSRGAYTARALAGMLHAVGLLPPSMPEQVQFAYKLYQNLGRGSVVSSDPGRNYKRDFCRAVTVDFLGVWDTVASVGILVPRALPFSQSNSSIKVFRHALALDERRAKFIPSPWRLTGAKKQCKNGNWVTKQAAEDAIAPDTEGIQATIDWVLALRDIFVGIFFKWFIEWWPHDILNRLGLINYGDHEPPTTLIPEEQFPPDLREVWFAGGHCDVGGGNVPDDKPWNEIDKLGPNEPRYSPSLANIPLRWMIREFYEADLKYNLNIRWRSVRLARYGIYLPPIIYTNDDGSDFNITLDDDLENRYLRRAQNPADRRSSTLPTSGRPPSPLVGGNTDPSRIAPSDVLVKPTDADKKVLGRHPRRANFLRSKEFKSGVKYDLDFFERDLKAESYDELWRWDRITFSAIVTMLWWWVLELAPLMRHVQNKHTFLWESKLRCNLFNPRDIHRGAVPQHTDALSKRWVEFLTNRSKPSYHWSVRERMKHKRGYRPRHWGDNEKIHETWIEVY